MSIIYEALKKVENRASSFSRSEKKGNLKDSGKKIRIFSGRRNIFLLSLALLINLGIWFALNNSNSVKSVSNKLNPKRRESKAAMAKNLKSTPEPKNYIPGKYIVEGIVYDSQAPFAIINGKVVKKSDKIDNFLVNNITQNTVELIDTEKNITLTLSL